MLPNKYTGGEASDQLHLVLRVNPVQMFREIYVNVLGCREIPPIGRALDEGIHHREPSACQEWNSIAGRREERSIRCPIRQRPQCKRLLKNLELAFKTILKDMFQSIHSTIHPLPIEAKSTACDATTFIYQMASSLQSEALSGIWLDSIPTAAWELNTQWAHLLATAVW